MSIYIDISTFFERVFVMHGKPYVFLYFQICGGFFHLKGSIDFLQGINFHISTSLGRHRCYLPLLGGLDKYGSRGPLVAFCVKYQLP